MHAHCTVCGSVIEAESALCADCRPLVICLCWGMSPAEADHYGLWEENWSQAERVETGVGASTGVKRWNYRRRELPGVSPAVIRFLLPITLFGNITDLGYELPPLYEDIVSVPMTAPQAAQYREASRSLLGAALELARIGDAGALSVWFNTVRFRLPSAASR
jgi:hypothetical protein